MPIYGGSPHNFTEQVTTGLDGNSTSTVTEALDVSQDDYITFDVVGTAGTYVTTVFTPQCSLDGTNWYSMTAAKITGEGRADNIQSTPKWFRVKCTTAEGGASTVTICIQAK